MKRITEKVLPSFFGQMFGSYLVLPETKRAHGGQWLVKIRCTECGRETWFKAVNLHKRRWCTCDQDLIRTKVLVEKAHPSYMAKMGRRTDKYPLDDLAEIWPSVVKAGKEFKKS